MDAATARAQARVGLLGNPSDLYGGRGLGFAVAELGVEVALAPAAAPSWPEEFFAAGWTLFVEELEERGVDPLERPSVLTFTSTIPFQSGLSGSSALLIAALRAWSAWYGVELASSRVAELAWRAENELLGIRAGTLDRLVQAHEGLLAMDFARPFEQGAVERLEPELLPPLLLAWHGRGATSSGDVHAPIYDRWQSGDASVTRVMTAVAENADAGRAALEQRDRPAFLRAVDANLALRRELFDVSEHDQALADLGRQRGAGAKLPGSGGAVLFACPDDEALEQIESACRDAGHTTLRPTVHESVR